MSHCCDNVDVSPVDVKVAVGFHSLRSKFDWSLKPLTVSMTFALGLNLNCSSKKSIIIRFLAPVLGFFAIFCNLAVNGPCGFGFIFYSYNSPYGNAFVRVSGNALSLLDFVRTICTAGFFLSIPLVHLILIINALLAKNWENVWFSLEKIQEKMKLDQEFHRKCHCCIILVLLILVFTCVH